MKIGLNHKHVYGIFSFGCVLNNKWIKFIPEVSQIRCLTDFEPSLLVIIIFQCKNRFPDVVRFPRHLYHDSWEVATSRLRMHLGGETTSGESVLTDSFLSDIDLTLSELQRNACSGPGATWAAVSLQTQKDR